MAPGEIAWIEPEPANIRTEEYVLFKSERIAKRLAGYELIGMRGLRDELRRGPYAATKADSPGRRAAG